MQAGAGDLAAGPQAGHAGAPGRVHGDAAHVVVRGRANRDRLRRGVDPRGAAEGVDRREMAREIRDAPGIEAHAAAGGEHAPNLARHHVARLQVAAREAGHHRGARAVDQGRALAAHRLADQRHRVAADVERGRVELHELHAAQGGAGQRGHGDARAVRAARVGGVVEQPAHAAGGQHHARGAQHQILAAALREDAAHAAPFRGRAIEQQAAGGQALQHRDRRRGGHGGDQGAHDLPAGAVAGGVHDAPARVRGLQPDAKRAVRVAVETGAVPCQRPDRGGPGLDDAAHRVRVAQAGTGGERVGDVQLGAVVRADGGGDAALRPGARRQGAERARGQDRDRPRRQVQRRQQAGEAGADDQHVVLRQTDLGHLNSLRGRVRGGQRRRP